MRARRSIRAARPLITVLILMCGALAPQPAIAGSWFVLPNVFYTPETGFGGGVVGALLMAPADSTRSSRVQAAVTFTERKQFALELLLALHPGGGDWRVELAAAAREYPDVFYGIGPGAVSEDEESFTLRGAETELTVTRRITGSFRGGARARLFRGSVTDEEIGGVLDSGEIPGVGDAVVVGLGPVLVWDTRDSDLYTTSGTMAEVSVVLHDAGIGSDYGFGHATVDLRGFVPVLGSHSLGLQVYVDSVSGDVPFFSLPRLGGVRHMRGYREGRFRDDVFATAQAEYRLPLWRNVRGALFVSCGEVAGAFQAFSIDGLRYAGGAGLRYGLGDGDLFIRADYAISGEGNGLYLTLGEAF